MISASDLGEDAEGAGLGGARAGVPVLRVLNQPLLAGVAVRGRVVELRVGIHNVLPWGAAQGQTDRHSRECEVPGNTSLWSPTKARVQLRLCSAFKGNLCVGMQKGSS